MTTWSVIVLSTRLFLNEQGQERVAACVRMQTIARTCKQSLLLRNVEHIRSIRRIRYSACY